MPMARQCRASVCGGASALTIMREITTDAAAKTLVANPVEEFALLRTGTLANVTTPIVIRAGTTLMVAGTANVDAAASSDIEVAFALPDANRPAVFGVCVLATPGSSTQHRRHVRCNSSTQHGKHVRHNSSNRRRRQVWRGSYNNQ